MARTIAAGIIPAAIEMMDRDAIAAAEAFVNVGYPLDVEALLIVELDGPEAECAHLLQEVTAIATACNAATLRVSNSEEERLGFWAGRKAAFRRWGHLAFRTICAWTAPSRASNCPRCWRGCANSPKSMASSAPTSSTPATAICTRSFLYDANKGEMDAAEAFGADILRLCAWKWAGCSPASLGWAWKSAT